MSQLKPIQKQIKIETILPMFDVVEDRIRLSFNHKDENNHVDFMMTRKFLLQLLPSYDEYIFKVYADKITDTPVNNIAKNKNPRLPNHAKLQPYQYHAELLQGIEFSYLRESNQTKLSFHTKSTKAYVTLNHNALVEIFSIIKSTIPYFGWGISPRL